MKLITTYAIAFVSLLSMPVLGQDESKCSQIEIATPRVKDLYGRGERYPLSVRVVPTLSNETKFHWEFSPALAFNVVDRSKYANDPGKNFESVEFVVSPDLNMALVTVTVSVEGLPPNCADKKVESFTIKFDTENPREISRFPWKEYSNGFDHNLFVVSETLKDSDDGIAAYFVIDYSRRDTKRALRRFIDQTTDVMVNKLEFPASKIRFAFNSKGTNLLTVYNWTTDGAIPWETDLDKLEIPD
jgi:hypothetical protein